MMIFTVKKCKPNTTIGIGGNSVADNLDSSVPDTCTFSSVIPNQLQIILFNTACNERFLVREETAAVARTTECMANDTKRKT